MRQSTFGVIFCDLSCSHVASHILMTVLYVQLFHIANFAHALAHARPTMSHIPLVIVDFKTLEQYDKLLLTTDQYFKGVIVWSSVVFCVHTLHMQPVIFTANDGKLPGCTIYQIFVLTNCWQRELTDHSQNS